MYPAGKMSKLSLIAIAAAMSLCAATSNAHAQAVIKVDPSTKEKPEEAPVDKPEIRSLPPAYDETMMRLAEILGALHYLRELCGAKEGTLWRDEMQQLIEKEEPDETRKAKLISRFNRGFRSYQEIHRECTDTAAEAANRFLRQATRLAAEIPGRYGQ